MWDEKYNCDDFVYGTEPNDFLRANAHHFPTHGKLLCLAEGEGRNAVWLATQGFDVTAVDSSAIGLAKAERLAKEKNTVIQVIHTDLADFDPGVEQWDGIIAIFAHLPLALRHQVHKACEKALKPSGIMLLEAYTPDQLNFGTGGPKNVDWLMTKQHLQKEFSHLTFIHLAEVERDVLEGIGHTGRGAVVQLLAKK